jgi:hypothetical protein
MPQSVALALSRPVAGAPSLASLGTLGCLLRRKEQTYDTFFLSLQRPNQSAYWRPICYGPILDDKQPTGPTSPRSVRRGQTVRP